MEIHNRILQKADELFSKYGFRAITLDEICNSLGISKKTLYQYFVDKDELVDAVMMNHFNTNYQECLMCSDKASNAIDEIFLMMSRIDDDFRNLNPIVMFDLKKFHFKTFEKFQTHMKENLKQMVAKNLQRGVLEGYYRNDFDIDLLARFRMACIWIPFDTDMFPSNTFSLPYVFKQVTEHFLYGLVNPKGYELIEKYKKQNNIL